MRIALHAMALRPIALLLTLLLSIGLLATSAGANPIYVITGRDGSIRFTNKAPPPGVTAKVFTARSTRVSTIKGWHLPRLKTLQHHKFVELISEAATRNNLHPALIRAVIHAESGFNPKAVSPKGARGLMQLMPATAKELGVKNSFDPAENIAAGSRYLAFLHQRYGGNLRLSLAAYNAGFGAVDRYKDVPPYSETVQYVGTVMELARRYQNAS